MIEDKASCDAAAEALGLSDTTAYESTSTSYPPGCVPSYGSLYLYPATNSYLLIERAASVPQAAVAAGAAGAAGATDDPGAVAQTGSYYLITAHARCRDRDGTCDAAAEALGPSDTSASTSTTQYSPPGCVLSSTTLYLYPASNDYYDCSSTRQCICAFSPPCRRRRCCRRRRRRRRLPPGYVAAVSGYYQLKSGSCGGALIEDKTSATLQR